MHKQKGATLIGMLLVGIIIVFAAIIVMKIVPAYIEYFSVKKVFGAMAADPSMKEATPAEARSSFERRIDAGYVTVVKPDDLDISRASGKPLFGNLGIYMDFSASTAPEAAQ
jgi:Tfp pilus assembly protein PilE